VSEIAQWVQKFKKKKLIFNFQCQMGCPALGIWVGFLKQPALPGKAPQKKFFKKISKK
jgi:hypothetical protein